MLQYSQKNIEELFSLIGSFPFAVCENHPGYDVIKAERSVWPNLIYNPRLNSKSLDALILEVQRGAVPGLVMLNPNDENLPHIEAFNKRGIRRGNWSAMSMDLSQFERTSSSDFKIDLAKDLSDWVELVEQCLMGDATLDLNIFQKLQQNEDTFLLECRVNNRLVSTSLLFLSEDSAGIYLVSSHPDFRNKGLGTSMMLHALDLAKQKGAKFVHIQATQIAKGLYASIGFKELGQIDVFSIS